MNKLIDKNGSIVKIGSKVRLLELSGNWLENLPQDEKEDVLSMIGEIFEIEEIDEYGWPTINKSWHNEKEGLYYSHSIALSPNEMELVNDNEI